MLSIEEVHGAEKGADSFLISSLILLVVAQMVANSVDMTIVNI